MSDGRNAGGRAGSLGNISVIIIIIIMMIMSSSNSSNNNNNNNNNNSNMQLSPAMRTFMWLLCY
jgi:hypothetical protein